MAFLLINNKSTSLINKVGENIYLREYVLNSPPRQNVLVKSISDDYFANIDSNHNIHLVYKNAQNKIIYFQINDSSMNKTLLEDAEDTYKICNLYLLPHKKNYLLYAANNPYENCTDLIFQSFDKDNQSAPRALLTLPSLTGKYQPAIYNEKLYILASVICEKGFELNVYTYDISTEEWEGYDTLLTSDCPIVDCCFILYEHKMHVTYITEKFGHYTLNYGRYYNEQFDSIPIISLGQKIEAVIFIYNKIIWVNYLTSGTLFSAFSHNSGNSFSNPIKCTVQNSDIIPIYVGLASSSSLQGNSFYGYIDKYPNIAILSQVDTDNVLFYSNSSEELKEVINATLTPSNTPIVNTNNKSLEQEIEYLKQVQQDITDKYNELATFAKEVQAEGKKWRNKYQKLSKEIKQLKKTASSTTNDNDDIHSANVNNKNNKESPSE